MDTPGSQLPAGIAARPVCTKRKLPIPFVTRVNPDGTGDFARIDPVQTELCVKLRLCGVCGLFVRYWIAFLGGPYSSAENGAYTEPGMHEECAEWALKLCPYLLRARTPYRGEKQEPVDSDVMTLYGEKERDGWVIQIARGYEVRSASLADGGTTLLMRPTGVARRREFAYVDGKITEKKGD
jgi:hypothetical protein